jgi:uncharacterized protein with GYD domain
MGSVPPVGGSLEAFYFALGENDFSIVANRPDDATRGRGDDG